MRTLNLEVAGEFLVVAATLLHIKSRLLLPPEKRRRRGGGAAASGQQLVNASGSGGESGRALERAQHVHPRVSARRVRRAPITLWRSLSSTCSPRCAVIGECRGRPRRSTERLSVAQSRRVLELWPSQEIAFEDSSATRADQRRGHHLSRGPRAGAAPPHRSAGRRVRRDPHRDRETGTEAWSRNCWRRRGGRQQGAQGGASSERDAG
jgi:hypothetical protein